MERVERVRGVNDTLPHQYEVNKRLEDQLGRCFEAFGYCPVDVPIIEHTDLYLIKSGEETLSRLFDFSFQSRRIALRPEMTASVMRAYIDNLQSLPLPVRLYHLGQVFRYEKPQRGRYRQFTQMGIELIGAPGHMADTELIYVACKGLNAVGVADYRVVIGHVGVLATFLESLSLEPRLRSLLLTNVEVLRKEGMQHVAHLLHRMYPTFRSRDIEDSHDQDSAPAAAKSEGTSSGRGSSAVFDSSDNTLNSLLVHGFIRSINADFTDTQDNVEIAERLLAKFRRQAETRKIDRALQFMHEIGQITGEPNRALEEAEKLLSTYGIGQETLQQLRVSLECLAYYPIDLSRIRVDFGLSRGLQYYTGLIFEVEHGPLGESRQLCGGGRYDDLIAAFGGKKDTAAAGFSFGIERLRLALESEGGLQVSSSTRVDVLVVPDQSSGVRQRRAARQQERRSAGG